MAYTDAIFLSKTGIRIGEVPIPLPPEWNFPTPQRANFRNPVVPLTRKVYPVQTYVRTTNQWGALPTYELKE